MNERDRCVLEAWGWNDRLDTALKSVSPDERATLAVGRVILELRGVLGVATAEGVVNARVAGQLRHSASTRGGKEESVSELPAVGDWVLLRLPRQDQQEGRIHRVLPRASKFSRKASGSRTEEQVVAANIDRLFVVMGLDGDFNPKRLQRYLVTARAGGSEPVVVLNKSDLTHTLAQQLEAVASIADEAPVAVISCQTEDGLVELGPHLVSGETVALVGSSGVGKSTLVNSLLGREEMKTGGVRASDDRGQHTTSHRQMLRLPGGALLIDNPGIREVHPWEAEAEIDETFDDVVQLALNCRFRNCSHHQEPGCAVRLAIEQGELSTDRVASFRALQLEAERLERKQQELAKVTEKKKLRAIHRAQRKHRPREFE